jgi:hypothetical protein
MSLLLLLYGVVSHKASQTLRLFLICCQFLIWVLNILIIQQPELSYCNQQRHLVAKQGETWREMAVNFAYEVSLSCSAGFLTCRKIIRHGADGFTSTPKEVVLRIFIAFNNPSSSAGFEPANLMSSGKNDNHKTTEADTLKCY